MAQAARRTIFSRVSKEDPKHGRWILPVVVAALIGFTYLFVNALPPAEIPVGTTTTTVAAETTTTTELVTTTTEPDPAACLVGVWRLRSQEFLDEIWLAGLLHDVGKIGIEDRVLNKGDVLTTVGSLALDHAPTSIVYWGGRVYMAGPDLGFVLADASLGNDLLMLDHLELAGADDVEEAQVHRSPRRRMPRCRSSPWWRRAWRCRRGHRRHRL